MEKNIEILDSTLRDGAQGEGISYSVQDKIHIVQALDELGVKYIEAGNPGSNPKDMEFFQKAKSLNLKNSRLVAFGSTRRKDSSRKNPLLQKNQRRRNADAGSARQKGIMQMNVPKRTKELQKLF